MRRLLGDFTWQKGEEMPSGKPYSSKHFLQFGSAMKLTLRWDETFMRYVEERNRRWRQGKRSNHVAGLTAGEGEWEGKRIG